MKDKTDINQLHINCTNCTMIARQPHAFDGTFVFFATHRPTLKNPKEPPSHHTKTAVNIDRQAKTERTPACNSTYKKLAVQWLNLPAGRQGYVKTEAKTSVGECMGAE